MPMFNITWKPRALKQMRKIPAKAGARIRRAVDTLAEPHAAKNVVPLKGHDYGFRMRVGEYRVLFDVDNAVRIVSIEEVKPRNERTY